MAGEELGPHEKLRFEMLVLPHLDAAYNLARWLLRNSSDAEDAAQESVLRAYRFFGRFRGIAARAWLLQIVRNTCYTRLAETRRTGSAIEFDEELHAATSPTPESLAVALHHSERLKAALESLPPKYREMIVLREIEGCSYREIATITSAPVGTVMSSLSRARRQLQLSLTSPSAEGAAR